MKSWVVPVGDGLENKARIERSAKQQLRIVKEKQ